MAVLFAMMSALMVSMLGAVFIDNDQDVGSPLRVAQCRASCLERFSNEGAEGESVCLQGPDCFKCWKYCEFLQSNFQVWGAMCSDKDVCVPGCQTACDFHSKKAQQAQPVIRTQGEAAVRIRGGRARWPRPGAVARETPLVYVVMQRRDGAAWRQLAQTAALSARIPPATVPARPLRVLAVAPHGLVAIYSPVDEQKYKISSLSTAQGKKRKTINTEVKSKDQSSSLNRWDLREVSLIHQKVLVIAEIAWATKALRGVYLVTWEIDGGGLKGNLFTDSTSVTLSLWPDTIYHIQVELVSHTPGLENLKSEMLNVDTKRAQKVSTQDDLQLISSEEAIAIELKNGQEITDRRNYPLFSILVNSIRGEKTNKERRHLEILAGSGAAVLLFILVLVAFIWRYRGYTGAASSLRHKLGEDFATSNKSIQPVKTVVFNGNDEAPSSGANLTNMLTTPTPSVGNGAIPKTTHATLNTAANIPSEVKV